MKKTTLSILFAFVFLASTAAARSNPAEITGGRFLITGGDEQPQNARLETAGFTATGFLGGRYSPWNDICKHDPNKCGLGKTFSVIPYPRVYLGGCIGDCFQFNRGTFEINGTTYQNAYYRGHFDFSQVSFQVPRTNRRKGSMTLRKPFSMTGRLQVCRESNIDRACPADKILYEGDLRGGGTLTVMGEMRVFDNGSRNYPYLFQKSFEYQFQR